MIADGGQQALDFPGTVVVLTRDAHLRQAREQRTECDVFLSVPRRKAHFEARDVAVCNCASAQRLG
jgi:hypothetical protein